MPSGPGVEGPQSICICHGPFRKQGLKANKAKKKYQRPQATQNAAVVEKEGIYDRVNDCRLIVGGISEQVEISTCSAHAILCNHHAQSNCGIFYQDSVGGTKLFHLALFAYDLLDIINDEPGLLLLAVPENGNVIEKIPFSEIR
ncbi:hypothetical protein TNCV_464791 [Trichonephila clavipes]|nr:hypothetical protein TNCV_464791 [Trichonephila clavipes]